MTLLQQAPRYFIPRHVHVCEAGGQVVFLDLRRDKYLAIGRNEQRALLGKVDGWSVGDEGSTPASAASGEAVIRSMLERGLLTRDARGGKAATQTTTAPVSQNLVKDDLEKHCAATSVHLLKLLLACARAKAKLLVNSLERTVETVHKRRSKALLQGYQFDVERDRALVTAFDRLRPFVFTARDACLFDSLALIEFLALHASYPTWVIGVETQPFGAHSWVQHEGFAYNGPVEYLRRFTPILVV